MTELKVPPHNIEAEESVLGSLMIDKDAIIKVADTLTPGAFYKPSHSRIYETILHLYEKRQPIDILSVQTKLKEDDALIDVGGVSYLTELVNRVPSASHIEHYATIVRDKKILRDLIHTSAEINEHAFKSTDDLDVVLDTIEQKIFAISQRTVTQQFRSLKEELQQAFARIERLHQGEGELRGTATGFSGLDNILSGLQSSDMIVLGARPSMGKTSLALDIARHVALHDKKPVAFFSLEMSRDQLIDRLISAESLVPLWKLRTGKISDESDFGLIQNALDLLSRAPIFIDDSAGLNILQMRSMARRLRTEQNLGLIVVDYLQLIQPRTASDNLVHQITEISRGLKALARELNVPVLALSQLNRSVDSREVKIPRLADLRDSGSIEQDSDVVMFIYRKDRDRSGVAPEEENIAEIIIAKHRNGPIGTVKLRFDPEKTRFMNIDSYHSDPDTV
jgi:replicative DNA helicase